ncbi:methyl-accepting chemotaxis protein [Chitinimonas sp. BJYL2]|uniref:methyl-accepting chemotaxis protein n=1 Tax=Chitinimonas sp. BJYL2 TaxID=2976696 RepID=UPI0022B37E48|nr:methyl-accepting chemotaxis protein [Chitinimonas sp. BJYL2]
MFQSFRNARISVQVLIVCGLVCTIVFSAITAYVATQTRAVAVAEAKQNLRNTLNVLNGLLDVAYHAAKRRGEREIAIFHDYIGGDLKPTGETTLAGEISVPVLATANGTMTGNLDILDAFKKASDGLEGAVVQRVDGKFVRTATMLKKEGKSMVGSVIKDDDPVAAAILAGKPYLDIILRNGKYSVSRAEPFKDANGQLLGYYSVRVPLGGDIEAINQILAKVTIGATGAVFAIAPTGDDNLGQLMVAREHVGKSVREAGDASLLDVTRELLANKQGDFHYQVERDGKTAEKFMVYDYNPNWKWHIAAGSYTDEFITGALDLQRKLIVLSILSALATVALLYVTILRQLKPLKDVQNGLAAIGQGRFSTRLREGGPRSHNEMDGLAHEINGMAGRLGELVQGVTDASTRVKESAGTLRTQTSEIADASLQQSRAASEMAAAVEELSQSIAEVASHTQSARELTRTVEQGAHDGLQRIDHSVTEIQRISSAVDESAQAIVALGERSKEITGIVGTIRDIAEQTNLLALNAAIEAARAGEHGRGFAVVADEVRKLAERTSSSTQEITQMVSNIQSETLTAAERMQVVNGMTLAGVDSVRAAGSSLREIAGRASEVSRIVTDIADAAGEQSTASQVVAQSVERIANMAQQNADACSHEDETANQLAQVATGLQSRLSSLNA